MLFKSILKPQGRLLILLVTAVFLNATIASQSMAGFVPSASPLNQALDRAQDLSVLQQALEIKVVSQRLKDLGYTKDEITSRLNRLSAAELHQAAVQVRNLRTGGDAVVTFLVVILLLIVIVKLLGHDIEIKPAKQ